MDEQALLETFLAERDAPCPGCGYNLRGLRGGACPECSQSLRLAVGLTEPRQGLWILGLVGAAVGAGFNALLLIYVAVQLIRSSGVRLRWDPFIVHNLFGLVLEGAVLAAYLLAARRIRRMPTAVRAGLALTTWAAVAANIGIFSVIIR